MRHRSLILICVALSFFIARAMGLHFHEPLSHHHEQQIADHVVPESGATDHALHHSEGATDVDAPLMVGTKSIFPVLLISCALLFWFVDSAPRSRRQRVTLPPLRPPRLRRRFLNLPPPLGPPAAAHIR